MANELRAELQSELDELHKQVTLARETDAEQLEIEQLTNEFEMQWLDRLTKEQEAEVRGAQKGIEAAFAEYTRQQQQENDRRDAQNLPSLSPKGQVAYWESNRPENGVNAYRAQENDRQSQQIMKTIIERINGEYAALRDDFDQAMQEIEAGRTPELPLTQVIDQVVEQEINKADEKWRDDFLALVNSKQNTHKPGDDGHSR